MSKPNPGATSASPETPVVLEAVNLTLRAIERRARLYRNLVIAVSITALAAMIVAVILRRWVVLAGVLALPVYVGGFLYLDNRIVQSWRRHVFQFRDERGLNIAELEKILMGLRHLPQPTIRSMVAIVTGEKAPAGHGDLPVEAVQSSGAGQWSAPASKGFNRHRLPEDQTRG